MIPALDLPVNGALLLTSLGAAALVRWGRATPWVALVGTGFVAGLLALVALVALGDLFAAMRTLAWYLFAWLPLLLAACAVAVTDASRWAAAVGAALVVLVGIDAFLIEPGWIAVRTERIESAKVDAPLTIAILADLQTDAPGPHERRALELALAAKPDVILLPGDYVQHHDPAENARLRAALRDLFLDVGLGAPLGVYAVRGNVDHGAWRQIFEGLPVTAHEASTVSQAGPVSVTALSFTDGFTAHLQVPPQPGLHIAVAHAPDFSLGDIQADLLVAGHTHGGQVQLPFIGPLITFSQVPRAWASGRTQLDGGRTLIVSRGVGMERDHAPRLRFGCRPEVVIVHVVPAD